MKAIITITHKNGGYLAQSRGFYGGGYNNMPAGKEPEEAAAFAKRELIRYGRGNPLGGTIIAPEEVLACIPPTEREIEPTTDAEGNTPPGRVP